ncbi:MAG: hypothetical protein ACI4JS_07920 [Oscillospiraceae bacterium]
MSKGHGEMKDALLSAGCGMTLKLVPSTTRYGMPSGESFKVHRFDWVN